MSYFNKLAKGFIRSAVNQVGRDGGRVVSNKVYKGKHSKPIYYHDPNVQQSSFQSGEVLSEANDLSEIDWNVQPNLIKSHPLVTFLKGYFIHIVPIFGFFIAIYKIFSSLNKRNATIYAVVENQIPDKRYKTGYRVDGNILVETNNRRELIPEEKKYFRNKGLIYAFAMILFYLTVYFIFGIEDV